MLGLLMASSTAPSSGRITMPAGYSNAFPVDFDPANVFRVGASQSMKTVAAGIAAANARSNTSDWALVAVDAGTYTEAIPSSVKLGGRTVLAAADGAGSVVAIGAGDHFAWTGGLHMIAGIDFQQATGTAYCLHLNASTGHFGFYEQCSFDATESTVGADVDNDGSLFFLECSFDSDSPAVTCTNIHGWSYNTVPSLVAFLDCTSTRGVGYNSLGGPMADALHAHGGSVASVYAEACTAYLDPGLSATLPGGARVNSTTWPTLPVRGSY